MRGIAGVSGCAISGLLGFSSSRGRSVARAELGNVFDGHFRRHAGAIGRVTRLRVMAAILAGSESGEVPPDG